MKILSIRENLKEIISSFKETSNNEFIFDFEQDKNQKRLQNQLK